MATETIKAGNVEVGDFIHFPNSRHPQEVTEITPNDERKTVTLRAAEAQWECPNLFDVKRVVQEKEESDGDQ